MRAFQVANFLFEREEKIKIFLSLLRRAQQTDDHIFIDVLFVVHYRFMDNCAPSGFLLIKIDVEKI